MKIQKILTTFFLTTSLLATASIALAFDSGSSGVDGAFEPTIDFGCCVEDLDVLNSHVEKGLPCGTDSFVHKLEKLIGHGLSYKPQGRPKKG